MLDRLAEALLLGREHLLHPRLLARQLRIRASHLRVEVVDEAVEERLLLPELVAVADRAADDPAQHVAAPLVAGDDAVDDQERAGADVVGDHAQARREVVGRVRLARRRADQRLEEVDLVVRVHVLQHGREPLETHAGVDAGLRQRRHGERAVHRLLAVELHEHEVPDLDVAVAVGLGRSRRPAPDLRAVVVEDLRAGAAGTGVGHLPEVVGGVLRALVVADAHDALARHADLVRPDVVGLVVVDVDGDPELVRRQPVGDGQQLPGVLDRVALEVVAEAEVAQHLEERVVPRRVADVLEVVVLAAGAQAALRGGRALVRTLVLAEEHVLELHHPGVDEQQRRIVARDERRRGDVRVTLRDEVVDEALADLGGFHGGFPAGCPRGSCSSGVVDLGL